MIRSRLASLRYVLYAIFALIGSVGAMEVALRVQDSYRRSVRPGNASDRGPMTTSWLTHHELKPLQSLVQVNPDTGARTRWTTNSFGLRGPEIAVPKPAGVYRIVCLGDETVLGAGVALSESFPVRLQEFLQPYTDLKVEVVNAGVPGYCPLLCYLQVRHRLLALQPDVLILNFDMSDVADDHRYRRYALVGSDGDVLTCPHPDLDVVPPQGERSPAEHFLLPQWAAEHLGGVWRRSLLSEPDRDINSPQGQYGWLEDEPPDWSIYIEQALAPIGRLHALAESVYGRFVLATYPAPWQVSATASAEGGVRVRAGVSDDAVYTSRRPFELLGEYAHRHGILYCDTSPAFQQSDDPDTLYFHRAARFSAAGHEFYARELAEFLQTRLPGVWNSRLSNRGLRVRPHPDGASVR